MTESNDDTLHALLGDLRLEVSDTARDAILCLSCGHSMPLDDDADVVGAMLRGSPPACARCSETIDVWKLLTASMIVGEQAVAFGVPLGLRHTVSLYRVPVSGVKELDLVQCGVPATARIFRVVHDCSSLQPGKIVDIDALDSAQPPRLRYRILGLWVSADSAPEDIQGQTAILWAPRDVDDSARLELFAALEAFSNGRLRDSIVPASVAVEAPLGRVLDDYFAWVNVGKERREAFLQDAATFSHQLNVLAPAVARHLAAPALPETVRGQLNRLRSLRNDVAHSGVTKELEPTDLGTCLAAAVVGFRYARLLGEFLSSAQRPT